MAKEKNVNNRGVQASDVGPDASMMPPGATDISGHLLAATNKAGFTPDMTKMDLIANPGFQANGGNQGLDNAYSFQNDGEPGLLGQDTDDYRVGGSGAIGDDHERPNVPSPEFTGESGTTNMGPQGDNLDWNSVGPYRYPEYPADTLQGTGFAGSLRGHTVID